MSDVKEIRINAFEMNTLGHLSGGLWAHPRDHSFRYKTLDYWTEALTRDNPDKTVWTPRDLAEATIVGGSTTTIVGTPLEIADALQEWQRDTGCDGFNISHAVRPESFTDFIELVVPELQARGAYKRAYGEGTFREKLFGRGRARLQAPHPAVAYRRTGTDIHPPAAEAAE